MRDGASDLGAIVFLVLVVAFTIAFAHDADPEAGRILARWIFGVIALIVVVRVFGINR